MTNVADQLHAATGDGVLADAQEIVDTTQNKRQSVINQEVQEALAERPVGDFQSERELIMGGVKGIDYGIQDAIAGYRWHTSFAFGDDYIVSERGHSTFPKVGDIIQFDTQISGDYIAVEYNEVTLENGFLWKDLEADDGSIGQDITTAEVTDGSIWRIKEILEDDGKNHMLYIYEPVNLGWSVREGILMLREYQSEVLNRLRAIENKLDAMEVINESDTDI